jgi:hypothetical protein
VPLVENQCSIHWIPQFLSLGVKRPGSEADYSFQTNAEIKKIWIYTSTPKYVFKVQCLVKHMDNFTFYPFSHTGDVAQK